MFLRYLYDNKLLLVVFFYFILSVIIKITTNVDICIPCFWRSIFNIRCPGCGLTTAFIALIDLELKSAIEINWLILVILPVGIYYIIMDYIKFINK